MAQHVGSISHCCTRHSLPLLACAHAPHIQACSAPFHIRSHKKKRMNQIKKMAQRGLLDPEKEDPFALFVASTNIRCTSG